MVRKPFLVQTGGRWYVRRKGLYYRITATPGTEDFDRQYWAILNGQGAACKTSWNALIDSYMQSDRWTALKPRTRADYQKVLDYLREKNGPRDMRRVTRADALAAMQKNKERVRFANYILQVMSVLCEQAIDLEWIKVNPVKGARHLRTPAGKRQEHVPWTDEAVAKWRAEARGQARLIFEIGLGSVQRPADWCVFDWDDFDGAALRLRQGKTDKPLVLPTSAELRAALDAARSAAGETPAGPILRSATGGRMSYFAMAAIMRGERKRLGLMAHDLHALRYRGVMELAWAGCDDDEIMSYSGHATKAMVAKYAGEARQIMQARSAAAKRGNRDGTNAEPVTRAVTA